jgi:GT2 family glycosyltransferase
MDAPRLRQSAARVSAALSSDTSTVSVAMATYNGAPHLLEQLESLAAQSRPPDELVVCDDGSSDDTFRILECFAERASFAVRAQHNATRLGITANFQKAVAGCSGDVIFFADQDDLWRRDKIETSLRVLDSAPGAGAMFSNGDVVDAAGNSLGYDLWRALGFTASEQQEVRAGRSQDVFLRHVVAAGTTMAFRSRYLPLLMPFPPLLSAHDAWVAFLASATSEIAILDEPLIRYRLHGANQFGLRLRGLSAQLAQARVQIESQAFAYAADFFGAAGERLRSEACADFTLRPAVLEAVDGKVAHARLRDALPSSFLARLPRVAGEALAGGYRRYSYGWKSVAQDLFLR